MHPTIAEQQELTALRMIVQYINANFANSDIEPSEYTKSHEDTTPCAAYSFYQENKDKHYIRFRLNSAHEIANGDICFKYVFIIDDFTSQVYEQYIPCTDSVYGILQRLIWRSIVQQFDYIMQELEPTGRNLVHYYIMLGFAFNYSPRLCKNKFTRLLECHEGKMPFREIELYKQVAYYGGMYYENEDVIILYEDEDPINNLRIYEKHSDVYYEIGKERLRRYMEYQSELMARFRLYVELIA